MNNLVRAIVPVIIGVGLWAAPVPTGLNHGAWIYFALFVAVVAGLVLEPIPPAVIGIVGITLAIILRLVPISAGKVPTPADAITWGLSGFSDGTVWLIFSAFMFALGYEKTGLGKRMALWLIKVMGRQTLGLGYAVAFADLVLAPFMPSITARSGGTIFPIIKNIPPLYGSTPESNQRGLGAYIMWTAMASSCVTSSMFLTGLAPNVLAQSLVQKTAKVTLSWTQWFMSFLPVGIILFLSTPLLTYLLYPPTQKTSKDAPTWAGAELAKMGSVTGKEIVMALLALGALVCWIFFKDQISATAVGLAAISMMVVCKVVSWEDVVSYKQAWNVLVWFATLVTLADGLSKTGFLNWFGQLIAGAMHGMSPIATMVGLIAVFFASHYMFASITAQVAAMLPVVLVTAMNVPELNMSFAAILLSSTLGIMGVITPYAAGHTPIYYGSGYIKGKDWWVLGFIFGAIYLGIFLLVGVPWNLTRI